MLLYSLAQHTPGENTPCVVLQYGIFLCGIQKFTDNLTHHIYHILKKQKAFLQQFVFSLTAPNFREDINNNVNLHLLLIPVLLIPCQILLLPLALLSGCLGDGEHKHQAVLSLCTFLPKELSAHRHTTGHLCSQILYTNQDAKMGNGERLSLYV